MRKSHACRKPTRQICRVAWRSVYCSGSGGLHAFNLLHHVGLIIRHQEVKFALWLAGGFAPRPARLSLDRSSHVLQTAGRGVFGRSIGSRPSFGQHSTAFFKILVGVLEGGRHRGLGGQTEPWWRPEHDGSEQYETGANKINTNGKWHGQDGDDGDNDDDVELVMMMMVVMMIMVMMVTMIMVMMVIMMMMTNWWWWWWWWWW